MLCFIDSKLKNREIWVAYNRSFRVCLHDVRLFLITRIDDMQQKLDPSWKKKESIRLVFFTKKQNNQCVTEYIGWYRLVEICRPSDHDRTVLYAQEMEALVDEKDVEDRVTFVRQQHLADMRDPIKVHSIFRYQLKK